VVDHLEDTTKERIFDELRNYCPVSVQTPVLYREWANQFAQDASPRSGADLEAIYQKALRYLTDRRTDGTHLYADKKDMITYAMCMVIAHKERGFSLRRMEDEMARLLYETDTRAREFVDRDPDFNPFELAAYVGKDLNDGGPRYIKNRMFLDVLTMDHIRIITGAMRTGVQLEFVGYMMNSHITFRSRILSMGLYTYTVAFKGRVIELTSNARIMPGGVVYLDSRTPYNSTVFQAIEQTLVGKPVDMGGFGEERAMEEDENVA
jgi:hypothetical protein